MGKTAYTILVGIDRPKRVPYKNNPVPSAIPRNGRSTNVLNVRWNWVLIDGFIDS